MKQTRLRRVRNRAHFVVAVPEVSGSSRLVRVQIPNWVTVYSETDEGLIPIASADR
jgi:hypothetical protein